MCKAFVVAISLSALFASPVWGQSGRATEVKAYKDYYTGSRPIYQAAPVTHVVPELNKVTYVLDARMIDTTVTDPTSVSAYGGAPTSESLVVKGTRVSPYLALSLKRFGLGFNLEAGDSTINYKYANTSYPTTQKSSLSYRGLGIYGFLKVIDGKFVDITLIGGGKSINAKHKVGYEQTNYNQSPFATTLSTYRYSLTTYDAGLNTQFQVLKSVNLIPWVNYSRTDTANAASQTGLSTAIDAIMIQDLDVFWRSQRVVDYGLDFSVRVGGIEVHLGGMLGSIFSSAGGSETVKDKGFSLSLSLHQKG